LWISARVMTVGYERRSLPLKAAGFLLAPVLFTFLAWIALWVLAKGTTVGGPDGITYLGLAVTIFGVLAEIVGALIASTFAKARALHSSNSPPRARP
jgi:hypothetical protein